MVRGEDGDDLQDLAAEDARAGPTVHGTRAMGRRRKALKGHVDVIVEQQSAAQRGDVQTFTKDYYKGNRVQAEMQHAANAAGVPGCPPLRLREWAGLGSNQRPWD